MKQKKQELIVSTNTKLLDFISTTRKDLTKKKIKQYIKYNMIEVNNKIVNNNNYSLSPQDIVTIYYEKRLINNVNIDILYEDKDIIVINKPCGLLTISNSKEKNLTAFKIVREYVRNINPKIYLFTIHRLDENTSGVLMFAKNEKTKKLFQNNWNNIVKKRIYLAQVEGNIPQTGRFHTYLKENKQGIVYSTKDKTGKEAITEYKTIKKFQDKTLLQINILTGRRNQIRVHLSENGNPIIGDKKYGSKIKSPRMMLHATTLELIDPRTNKTLTINAKIPPEFYK